MFKKIILLLFIFLISAPVFAKEAIEADYNKKEKFYIYKIDLESVGERIRPYVVKYR